ncbi:deoxycytidyl transferase Rev1 [Schizosaccharomyces cryophilus OY26]|uniref:DNA repair protein REV1 n=1 Tax=Schizosaccharomyces cryophilus (strain OY26 / ATCC MYA-4695 / CBS 11777 / NBRC 106824 / NRRL Y48691) TaxID=653667 RepID=S9W4T2_SCHCR|nr:deoxycytidyl transferase Rev1 [Schizosaccharomyces cryophilus OY26]EPY53534.1 deoxycytidyl transferase Rev1 [Schizosaccharomyces cryophilus OY26]
MALQRKKREHPSGNADFNEIEDEAYESVGFHDYGDYFERKKRKLQNQNAALYKDMEDSSKSNLFEGLSMAINGYTNPSYSELRTMIIQNGGTFVQYVDRKTSISFLICSFLTPSKAIQWKHHKVVTPQWIVDCVRQQKLLPWMNYRAVQPAASQSLLAFPDAFKKYDPQVSEQLHESSEVEGQPQDALPSYHLEQTETKENKDELSNRLDSLSRSALHNYHLLKNPNIRKSTTQNPEFLQKFFDSSRLHHLSTWKATLKEEIQIMTASSSSLTSTGNIKSGNKQHYIMHVDFDCFFASVSTRNARELQLKPVAVAHGIRNSEIASCNYEARKYGIKNGMFVSTAKSLCPSLVLVDYDFDAYESVSREFYSVLADTPNDCLKVISIDEALLDLTTHVDSFEECTKVAESIRTRVRTKTNCDVSVGIGSNVLLARLALRKAKPHNIFYIKDEDACEFLQCLSVQDLPGVGPSQSFKLFDLYGVKTVGDLQQINKHGLQETFGVNYGLHLYNIARGVDTSHISNETPRRSVSVDVNWGVRFIFLEDAMDFLKRLLKELLIRMSKCDVVLHQLQLRVLKRAENAPFDPAKYLGAGEVTTLTKSAMFTSATKSFDILFRQVINLYTSLNVDPGDVRGIGLQALKIVKDDKNERVFNFNAPLKTPHKQILPGPLNEQQGQNQGNENIEASSTCTTFIPSTPYDLPSASQVSPSVLAQLPQSMQGNIRRQLELQNKRVDEIPSQLDPLFLKELPTPIRNEVKEDHEITINRRLKLKSHVQPNDNIPTETAKKIQQQDAFEKMLRPNKKVKKQYIPQVDLQVLEELPKEIQETVLEETKVNRYDLAREVKMIPNPVITFQQKQSINELRELLARWYEKTPRGPNSRDVDYFSKYLGRVIREERNLLKVQALIRWLQQLNRKDKIGAWQMAIEKTVEVVQEACFIRQTPPLVLL